MPTVENAQDWAVLPYNTRRIKTHYLVSNFLGNWDFLLPEELKRLERFELDSGDGLFDRLLEKGIIAQKENLEGLIADYQKLQGNLFLDTGLHIAVVTTRCNITCHYCHAYVTKPVDMDVAVATQVMKYLFGVRRKNVTLELQGGEPLLNWDIVKFLVENTRKFNTTNKDIHICMVTNGTLLSDEKIDFLLDHNVFICVSLDGPEHLHDKNRPFEKGAGSYKFAAAAIERLMKAYKKRNINKPVDMLPTFTKYNLPYIKDVIDEHRKWGAKQIAIRAINNIGKASNYWQEIGVTPEAFNRAWAEGVDYLLELNKQGEVIQERMAVVHLKKILKKEDPGYVDVMSPCGAGRSVLTYDPSGDVYPCDEGRMLGSEIFKLGNMMTDEYEQIMKSPNLFPMCQSTVMDLWSYNDAYLPWIGTCPIMNYKSQGTLVPKITQTPLHKTLHFQMDYLFTKMLEDKSAKTIFEKWAGLERR